MRSLLVASQKGGVGKTTTAVNLACLAGAAGVRVLLLDADPLGSVAASLQLSREPGDPGPAPRPDPVTGAGTIWPRALPGVDVVTPYPASDTAERHLQAFLDGLPKSPLARTHQLVLIDAPPMLGPRPKALLRAAGELVLVQRAEPMSIRTIPAYLNLVQQVRSEGGSCRLRGVLLTLPEGVGPGSPTETNLRAKFPGIFPQTIPFDPQVARSLVLGSPLATVSPDSPAARGYRSLGDALGLAVPVSAPQPVLVGAGPQSVARSEARPAAVTLPRSPIPAAPRIDDTPPPRAISAAPLEEATPHNPLRLPPECEAGDGDNSPRWLVALATVMLLAVVVLGAVVLFRG